MDMKKILIALGSDAGARKLAWAGYGFAKSLDAKTVLLHITPEPAYYASLKYSPILGFEVLSALNVVETENGLEIKERGESFLNAVKEYIGDHSIETIVRTGNIEQNILQTIAEADIDLVVLGAHRGSGIDRILSPGLAEKLLHHCSVPLLVIPLSSN
jgi:nucleotide-binding universal stress UspA family protein